LPLEVLLRPISWTLPINIASQSYAGIPTRDSIEIKSFCMTGDCGGLIVVLELLPVSFVSDTCVFDNLDDLDFCSCCNSSGASNFLYCAIILLQVSHLYSPFSYSVTPSPRSSLGFSKLIFGDPS
jgi:hypothetical protein